MGIVSIISAAGISCQEDVIWKIAFHYMTTFGSGLMVKPNQLQLYVKKAAYLCAEMFCSLLFQI